MGKRAHGEGSIFQRKDGRWQGALTVGYTTVGKQKRRTVYGKTQAEVLAKLADLRNQFVLGTLPETDLKVSTYVDRWLAEKSKSIKPRTVDAYTQVIGDYIKPRIGKHKLDRLKPLHIQAMVSDVSKDVSPDAANKARRVLYGALKQAVRWQLIPRNPVEAVEPLTVEKKAMTLWTPEEAASFLATAREDRLYALFYLAMSTGLRRGELLGLQWSDLTTNRLRVQRSLTASESGLILGTPKTKKGGRTVVLTADTVAVLEEHRKRQKAEWKYLGEAWRRPEVVFTNELGDYLDPNNLGRTWRRLQDVAGVRKARFHDLRHLHASIAIRAGMDPKVLADRLGHSRASFTLDVYTHLFDEQKEASAVSVQALFKSDGTAGDHKPS